MNRERIREAVVAALRTAYNETGGEVSARVLAGNLGVPVGDVCAVIGELEQRNLVRTEVGCEFAALSPLGIAQLVPGDPAAARGGDVNLIHVCGGIHGGAVSLGQSTATVVNQQSTFLHDLAQKVQNCPNIEPEQRQHWAKTLWEMSKHPALVALLGSLV